MKTSRILISVMKPKKRKTMNNNEIGIRIKCLRREKNMTQTDLAEKLRVTRTCITNWENGIRQPDNKTLIMMSQLFSVPVDYIYGRTNHRYDIKVPDYLSINFSKLNADGISMLYEYYKYLISNDRFKAE